VRNLIEGVHGDEGRRQKKITLSAEMDQNGDTVGISRPVKSLD